MPPLYHYTSQSSADRIKRCGHINPATHTAYGDGVYLTDLGPGDKPWHVIEYENWQSEAMHEKFEVAIKFSSVPGATQVASKRHIWLYRGGTLSVSSATFHTLKNTGIWVMSDDGRERSYGHAVYVRNWTHRGEFSRHSHSHDEVFYIKRGFMTFVDHSHGEQVTARAGQKVVVRKGVEHSLKDSDVTANIYWGRAKVGGGYCTIM
eukprot:TRINITY_DN5902_c0_g1_i1.p1 TRINITY_DN5902_c0_g1~~TRINITY_DN5902_c0_g1_i1.p1  ORF type:complete len:242 (+),score=57.63 TRINITY_DN5902_c0_g1_i1:110-727(+)